MMGRMGETGVGQGPAGATGLLDAGVQAPSGSLHTLARLHRYRQYRAFYLGYHWETLPRAGDVRLTLNYARVFVNKVASYLMSKPVGYNAEPVEETRESLRTSASRQVEAYMDGVSQFNNLAGLDLDTAIMAGALGDGCWTVRWDPTAAMPRVTGVDPTSIDCRWRGDDLSTLLWLRQGYYVMPAELTPVQLDRLRAAGGALQAYQPLPAYEEWTPREWSLRVGGVTIDEGLNPYGEIPYVLFPNLRVPGEFWGEGDLVDIMELNRELNKRVSVFSLLLDVAGNPIATITGATPEETAGLRVGPNQLWTLPEGASAGVLDLLKAGGADAHMKYIEALYRAMHDISETPRTAFGDSMGHGMARSGIALEIEMQPLLHKVARKQALLGRALVARAQLILRIARLHGEKLPAVRLNLSWPPVLPMDREALVAQETQLVHAMIHSYTRANELLGESDPDGALRQVISQGRELVDAGLLAPARPHSPAQLGVQRLGGLSPSGMGSSSEMPGGGKG
ncbi:MAG: phage portal protein [Chloroflexota bacterium]|nr:phage portal protein [Chloroflexota bacterium]